MKHHFYATVMGGNYKTPASRGSNIGGQIVSHTRGWECGVKVVGKHLYASGEDFFKVYRTNGSNADDPPTLICTVWDKGEIDIETLRPTLEPEGQIPMELALRKLMKASWIGHMTAEQTDEFHRAIAAAHEALAVLVT